MDSADLTRSKVAEDYAAAIGRTSCCGSSGGGLAALAGYTGEELSHLPEGAAGSSFGCGNPLALSDIRPGDRVLDLGSGAGLDLILAARLAGSEGRVTGIDMTDEMIARARANIASAGLANTEVRKGIIEDLPVESGSIDIVISNCVINLSPEKARVFSEISRVLRPGGTMTVSDLVAESLPEAIRADRGLYSSCLAGAVSEGEYVSALKEAGLVEVEVIDRLVYDKAQFQALFSSGSGCSCCSSGTGGFDDGLLDALAGKVASIRIRARKPF